MQRKVWFGAASFAAMALAGWAILSADQGLPLEPAHESGAEYRPARLRAGSQIPTGHSVHVWSDITQPQTETSDHRHSGRSQQ